MKFGSNWFCSSLYDMLVAGYAEINKMETFLLWQYSDQS